MPTPTPLSVQQHIWNANECICGSETVICQGCGKPVCGAVGIWTKVATDRSGNVGHCCFAKFGIGHMGTEAK